MKADHRPLLFWLCYEKKHFQKQSLRLGWSALSNAHCDCRLYFFALNSGTASQTRLGGAHTGVCWGGTGAGGARVGCGEPLQSNACGGWIRNSLCRKLYLTQCV